MGRYGRAAVHGRRRLAAGRRRHGEGRGDQRQAGLRPRQTLLKTAAGTQKTLEDAEAALRTAQARLNSAQTRLARRKMASPVAGTVQQIYFRPGEMVPAGRPVVSILPPGNIKMRFFVPEAMLPTIAIGDEVDDPLRRLQGRRARPR